jgi:hypothetical protein
MRKLVLVLLLSGCYAHSILLPPRKPCLSAPVPEREKLQMFAGPTRSQFVDPDGSNPEWGISLSASQESFTKFFGYVQALEAIAARAAVCKE